MQESSESDKVARLVVIMPNESGTVVVKQSIALIARESEYRVLHGS